MTPRDQEGKEREVGNRFSRGRKKGCEGMSLLMRGSKTYTEKRRERKSSCTMPKCQVDGNSG